MVTAHSASLSGLSPGTTYYYRVKSRDAATNLAQQAAGPFTTSPPPDTTPPVISNVSHSGITSSGATITWTTNEASDTQVEYGTTTGYGSWSTLSSAMVTGHSVNLTGLAAGTAYYYRVRSRDAASNLGMQAAGPFTTSAPPDTTPPVISGVSHSSITTSGATISWTTNEPSNTQVEYGTTTAYGTMTTLNPSMVTNHSATLSGLAASTTYYYRVRSRDAANNLGMQAAGPFTTASPDTTPPVISSVNQSSITTSGAIITWTTNEASNTQVEYGTTTAYGTMTTLNPAMVTNHSAGLTGLSQGTTYYYRVRSRDAATNLGMQAGGPFTTEPASVSHTIMSSPAGRSLTVDGLPCTSPCAFQWAPGSNHTIATTVRQPPQFFSYWSDNGALSHQVTASASPATYTAQFYTDGAQALRQCLLSSASSVCKLAEGTHPVAPGTEIVISRANVTVEGENSDRALNKLVRSPAFTGPIVQVDSGTALSGITVQNLTVCGSSTLTPGASPVGCPRVQTTCGNMTADFENPLNFQCVDFEVLNAAVMTNPSTNPFTYTGPYAVTLNNIALEDAAGHALSLYAHATLGKKVNDIHIAGSAINRSEITGILTGVNGADYVRKFCDSAPGFKDDLSLYSPRNLRIEGNTFTGNQTGAIGMNAARWVGLRNNTFADNYRNPQVGNIEGGTAFFDQCTDTIEITGNTMTGPTNNYGQTQGLELWGRNITVQNNPNISGYANDGIQLNSVYNATVTNNNVHDNDLNRFSIGYKIGGIQVWTSAPWGVCGQIPRDTQGVSVYGNTSIGQAYGIGLGDRGARSRNVLNGLNFFSNTLAPNDDAPIARYNPFVAWNGSVSPVPINVPDNEPSPRALPVDAVSPSTLLCKAPGDARQTFTFSGTEKDGAANIASVQGYFSVDGDDRSGPLGQGCHFIYFPTPYNVVYLDGPNGDFTWTGGASSVGPGGTSLSNGLCTIHAGSLASMAFMEGTILNVSLDIEFPQSGMSPYQKRIYESIQNAQGSISLEIVSETESTQWPYFGWWATQ